jgi:hypothetical protein
VLEGQWGSSIQAQLRARLVRESSRPLIHETGDRAGVEGNNVWKQNGKEQAGMHSTGWERCLVFVRIGLEADGQKAQRKYHVN